MRSLGFVFLRPVAAGPVTGALSLRYILFVVLSFGKYVFILFIVNF